jgi:hypothetical protein
MYLRIDDLMAGIRTWVIQVAVLAIVFSLFFGLVIGKRGLTLIVFVVVLSLIPPSILYFRTRMLERGR